MAEKTIQSIFGFIDRYFLVFSLGIVLIAAFNCFYHLDVERVWDWDEARVGVTAYEMIQNHNYIVSTYDHKTELWNLKPPLGLWLVVLDYKLFGFNVFSLRFYSALSCLLSVLVVLWITAREVGRPPAFLSGLILATTSPMIFMHGARSGDYSPLFTLLVLLFIVFLFKSPAQPRNFYLAGIVFALSFLVYSFAAFQLMILAFVYWFITGDYKRISLKNYSAFFICAFLPITGWAVWRLLSADGWAFINKMVSYDLIMRATQPLEGHTGGFDSYFVGMATSDPFWFTFMSVVLISILSTIGFKPDFKNRFLTLSSLGVVVPLILFSFAKTKLGWYLIPSYPPFAITTGCLAWYLLNDRRCQASAKVVILVLLLIAGLRAQREIQKTIRAPKQETAQNLLNDFKRTAYPAGSAIYSKWWTQADQFLAEVVLGEDPVSVKDLNECLNRPGYLMIEKEKKNTDSEDFVAAHKLAVVVQNENWVIVKL